MGVLNDLLGKRFGTLIVIKQEKSSGGSGSARWKVKCEKCKGKYIISGYKLSNDKVKCCKYCNKSDRWLFTPKVLSEIMKLREGGSTYKMIGDIYNVSQATIHRNVKRMMKKESNE